MSRPRRYSDKTGNLNNRSMIATAVDIEEAAHAINNINRRKKREAREKAEANKPAVTLGSSEWLAKFMGKS